MADSESPRPFRRERNLSNRNFAKRGSNHRRQSTESHSSIETRLHDKTNVENTSSITQFSTQLAEFPASPINMADTIETAVNHKPMQKMRSLDFTVTSSIAITDTETENSPEDSLHSPASEELQPSTPDTPDPAWLGVQQKRILFENLQTSEGLKTSKLKSKSTQSLLSNERQLATRNSKSPSPTTSSSSKSGAYLLNSPTESLSMAHRNSSYHQSIDEERSEDEVDAIEDEVAEDADDFGRTESSHDESGTDENRQSIVDKTETPVAAVNTTFLTPFFSHSKSHDPSETKTDVENKETPKEPEEVQIKPKPKDFPR